MIEKDFSFIGDNPQARFGHTITQIGKDKAILFGGAVGDTGSNNNLIKANTELQEIPIFVNSYAKNLESCNVKVCHHPIGLPMLQSASKITCIFMEGHLVEDN